MAVLFMLSACPVQQAFANSTYLITFKNGTEVDVANSMVVYTTQTTANNTLDPQEAKRAETAFDWPADKAVTGWYAAGDASKTAIHFETHVFQADTILLPLYIDQAKPYVIFQSEGLSTTVSRVSRGAVVAEPTDPVRSGYAFQYWTLDGQTPFDFTTPIVQNTFLHAVWTGETVPFKVLFYIEKADMPQDGTPGVFSEYEYLQTIELTGIAGTYTNLQENMAAYGLDAYFLGHHRETELKYTELQAADNKRIAGDGTTVINAFVKRKTYTFYYNLGKPGLGSTDPASYGMVIDDTRITAADEPYCTSAKYGNMLLGPNLETTYFDSVTNKVVESWQYDAAMSASGNGASAVLEPAEVVSASYISADGQTAAYTFTGKWNILNNILYIRAWVEPVSEDVEGTLLIMPSNMHANIAGKTFLHYEKADLTLRLKSTGFRLYPPEDGYKSIITSGTSIASVGQTGIYQDLDTGAFYLKSAGNLVHTTSYFFSRNRYQLKFDLQNGMIPEGADYSARTLKYETPLAEYALQAPERPGYRFLGWYENPDFTEPFDFENTTMPAKDFYLFAKWQEIVDEYTVNFYNYYDGEIMDTQVIRKGETADEKNEYFSLHEVYDYGVFNGWRYQVRETQGVSSDFTFGLPVYEDLDVYASWDPGYYTVTYDLAGGTGRVPVDSNCYAPGTQARVAAAKGFTHQGKRFAGWNTAADGTGDAYAAAETVNMTENVVLYAQWDEKTGGGNETGAPSYTVDYHANGGTGSAGDTGLRLGATHTVKAQAETGIKRDGWSFVGWNTRQDGTGKAYVAADTFSVSGNVTLYAQWKKAAPDQGADNQTTPSLNTQDHMAYVVGYADGRVRPEANITRAEVATIYFRLLTEAYRDNVWATVNAFTDVSATSWYHNAVSTMSNANIIQGYPDGTFGGDHNITRAEFAAIAARFDSSEYVGADKFHDTAGHWAAQQINRAAQRGWITGYEDGSFQPDQYITRAEAMTLINRVLGRDKIAHMHTDMKTWTDNPTAAWYYEAVQEATNSHEYHRDADTGAESWTKVTATPDWTALEKSWSEANAV